MLRLLRSWLSNVIQTSLFKNTSWMLVGQAGRVVAQAVYFIVIGRALGVEGFGTLAAAVAMVFILAPFASWGSGNVLIMHVSRRPSTFPLYWGNALLTIGLSAVVLMLVVLIIQSQLVTTIPLTLVLTLAIAEFFFGRTVEVCAQAFQAFDRLKITSQLLLLPFVLRAVAVLGFVGVTDTPTPGAWANWYLVANLGACLLAVSWTFRQLGRPRFMPSLVPSTVKDGWFFSVGLASHTVTSDIDKTMLARLSTFDVTGIYAAGYRVVLMTVLPLNAVMYALYRRFFQRGQDGIQGSVAVARRFLPLAALYGLGASIALLIFAPLIPHILGDEYQDSVQAVRWLAFLPLLHAVQYFGADALTGAGYQSVRSAFQVSAAAVNVLLNLWLIPRFSWKGAVLSTLVSELLMMILIWGAILMLRGRAQDITNA